jgi:hypothetical protein
MNRFTIGLDLGQVSDPTALSTLDERLDLKTVQSPEEAMLGAKGKKIYSRSYHLRQLERPPLGTSYPEIVRWIQDIVNNPILAGQTDLVVDATGVGRPVIQIMQEAGLNPIPVVITFGEIGKDVVMGDDGYFRVPKVDIMASLQVLFGSSRLRYPEVIYDRQGVNLVPVWLHEMEQFKMKRTRAGNMTYEAWRESDHDDIVLSIAISCWWILYSRPKEEIHESQPEVEEEYNPHAVMRSVLKRRY